MRVFTNEGRVKRNRRLAQILFFASLAILIGGLILTNTIGQQNIYLAFVPCVVMPIGLVTTWYSVRLTNQFVREPHPEDAIQSGLKGASHHSVLYNYLFKANHVLICPEGVYAFVARYQDGPFKIQGETWYNQKARGLFGRFFVFMRQEQLGDPFKEARAAAADLQARVDAALPGAGVTVQPVVVFTGEKSQVEVNDPALPVVLANSKKRPSLKSLVREKKKRGEKTLTPAQVATLEAALNSELSIEGEGEEVASEDAT